MKIWKKATALLLLVCIILPLAVSCSGKEDANQLVLFTAKGKRNYTVVRPENGSGRVVDAANRIADTLKEKLGITVSVVSDGKQTGEKDASDTRELLIGETCRAESAEAKNALGDSPYVIKAFENGKIAIVGADDVMTASAVHYFIQNCVEPAGDGRVVLARDFSFSAEVSDQPISRYSDGAYRVRFAGMPIVYGADSGFVFTAGFAQAYARRAALNCQDDSTAPTSDYEILLGRCARDEFVGSPEALLFRDFFVSVKDNKVSVDAVSAYGFEAAFRFLDDALTAGYADIPADGLLVRYDYGDTQLGRLLENYENPYIEGARPVAVAHRGNYSSSSKDPENSVAAYTACIEGNVDIIETDLRQTRDGHWVICHDANLRRTTSGAAAYTNMEISAITLDKIRLLNLKQGEGGDSARETDQKMPTLDEIIALGKDRVMYNIDKTTSLESFKPVYDVFEQYGAVDSAMFKSGESAEMIAGWFAGLIEAGRKLPLFAPMIYVGDDEKPAVIRSFRGLTSMTETSAELPDSPKLDVVLSAAKEANIRLMVLTIYSDLEGVALWKSYAAKGITGVMTNRASKFVGLYQKD
ncbi:MAG: glycerophosphodiester phosphodiesterase family protein [Lachnospiraceae bacterium]|nr:glycerophosphodiester phosphodiesterase family protein [Lachnospiraceae bacterium]